MSGMFLNFCECILKFDNPCVYSTPFIDSDWLKGLRKNHSDVSFLRSKNLVYFWGYGTEDPVIKDINDVEKVHITENEHPFIISKMLEDKILQIFKTQYKDLKRNHYSNTWQIYANDSFFNDEGLSIKRCITLSTYYSKFKKKYIFAFTIGTQLKHHFLWNKEDFINNGIACADLKGVEDVIFANKTAIKRYIEARGKSILYNETIRKSNSYSTEYDIINKTMSWLGKKLEKCYLNTGIMIDGCKIKYLPYDSDISTKILQKPKRYYANDVEGNIGKYDDQIKKLKPYSYLSMKKSIKIIAVIPKIYEGTASDFLVKLKNTLINVFHITNVDISIVLTEGVTLDDYEKAIYDRMFENIDLAIIIVSEAQIDLPIKKSPYYFCKAKYIGQAIPTQEIQIEKLRTTTGLPYIVNNVALNLYAKLGGTPWGVEKTKHLKKEFVVGIGSTVDSNNKAVMGIANIFDSSGKYFVGECIPLSGYEDYSKKLEDAIFIQINSLIGSHSDEIRIIFHMFKSPSNKYEIKALENVINRLQNIIVKYAFVHVGYGHNFRLYNNNGKSNLDKGYYIHLSENEALINFVDRGSIPLKITVDNRSSFQDIYYLAQQIYWFSHLSCRSYIPAKKSVSITYPSIMASITEKLKQIDGWDYNILQKVGEKLWFL